MNSEPLKENPYENYRQSLQDTITACEKEFDYRATYLSAGAIALTLAFISSERFSATTWNVFLIAGVLLEIIALIMNLQSFFYTKRLCRDEMDKIDENPEAKFDYNKLALKLAKKIDCYNMCTNIILVVGISSLTIFVTINTIKFESLIRSSPLTEQNVPFVINNNPTVQISTTNKQDTTIIITTKAPTTTINNY